MLKAIHRMQRDERGFTLVELLIVIAIIAILAAIAIPQFGQYRKKAQIAKAESAVKICVQQAIADYANNGFNGTKTCTDATATISNDGVVNAATYTGGGGVSCTFDNTNMTTTCS